MGKNADALKKVAVALGYGSATSEYTSRTIAGVLKEMAVKMECATRVEDIHAHKTYGVLEYIANNYGSEENEPYNLSKTETHCTVVFERNGQTLNTGNDILFNGDKIKITATGSTGYDVTTLTVNGTAFVSGSTYTVNGHNVAVVATGTLQQFYLERQATNCTVTVTKGGQAVSDGDDALTYGDTITITATATEGYEMEQLLVNGESFVSGSTLTVTENVNILATAEAETTE